MTIHAINIYRDGGTILFAYLDDRGVAQSVLLASPYDGEPRDLMIGGAPMHPGDDEVSEMPRAIDLWWAAVSPDVQQRVNEVLTINGAFVNSSPELSQAIDFSYVITVRDYVQRVYLG